VERDGDNYKFRKAGSDADYLYNINSNNGVRVGTDNANQYVFKNGGENDVPFMKNTSNSRYIGVYDNSNWRCYTTIINNIKNTVTAFYKKQAASSGGGSGYTVTMKDGVKDADKWTVKVGEGEAQALPIGGLKGDGKETVTLQYNGRLKVKGVTATSDAEPAAQADPLAVPMTIEAITAGSIKVMDPKAGMQYSLDGGKTKNAVTTDDIVLNAGDKVQFYGNGTSITSYDDTNITGNGDGFTCKVYGNIMSLVDETGFATATTLPANYTFSLLFSDFITLTDASGLLLPATTLANSCYQQMFYGCTSLTKAPALPATQLAYGCYQMMFRGCARLTAAPELPATQLTDVCYRQMFDGCTSLTTAPGLPATQLATACYQQMFSNCTALTASPMLPAETLVSNCYRQMFFGCSKLATVTCLATSGIGNNNNYWLQGAGSQAEGTRTVYIVSTANWPTGNNGIPSNWTRVNVDN
jgi:hypothetical protein